MSKRTVTGAFAALLIFAPVAVGEDHPPPYASATEAYRQGINAFKADRVEAALPALDYAARHGVLGAQLKLARLYAAGRGVPRNDAKAFFYYQQIASQQAELSPSNPVAKFVGEAFVALGKYYVDGIQTMPLRADPAYAASLFRHAASYFGNAEAQYQLAKLYLAGKGVEKNPSLAVNWLAMSAKKQHAASQAVLGEMLWRGTEVRLNRARGLALLMLAQENKTSDRDQIWIGDLYREAFAKSDAVVRDKAEAMLPRLGGEKRAAAIAKAKPGEPMVETATREAAAPAAEAAPLATPAESIPGDAGGSPLAAPIGLSVGFGATPAEN
ncbi:MAG: tetratricopeptide repeat protein [Methyloceanibacter sp.]